MAQQENADNVFMMIKNNELVEMKKQMPLGGNGICGVLAHQSTPPGTANQAGMVGQSIAGADDTSTRLNCTI